MYRMMIIDDEDEERLGIRYLLKKFGFEFSFIEANNGKEALEKLEENEVDIMLTDVKMPFLDGIELSKIVRKKFPDMQIVFFSGYDDFEYVKQALSIQAVDYILKPVNPEEFTKVISFVMKKMDEKKVINQYNQQFLRVYALTRLLNQMPLEKLKSEYQEKELLFLESYKRMLIIEFQEDFFGKKVEGVHELNRELKNVISVPYELIDINPAQGIVLFQEEDKEEAYFREVAKCIHFMIEKEYFVQCFVAISAPISTPEKIGTVYQQTEEYLEDRFFYKDTYIYPLEVNERKEERVPVNVNQIIQAIEDDIKFRDVFSLQKNVEILLSKCENNEFSSYIYTRFVCANLIKTLFQGFPDQKDLLEKKVEEIYKYRHFSLIKKSLMEIMNELIKSLESQQDLPKHMIAIVEKYIHEHYMDVLSLDILADKVYLTPHYLSSIFSQEKGIGINKYIKKVRMDKAEELLRTTNMKINDICKAVGYTNLSYFCKTFRNELGVTPEKYRDR